MHLYLQCIFFSFKIVRPGLFGKGIVAIHNFTLVVIKCSTWSVTRAGESENFSRLLIAPKFLKLLLPTPSKKFYCIAIRKYIIPFYAIYFHPLNASNKYMQKHVYLTNFAYFGNKLRKFSIF